MSISGLSPLISDGMVIQRSAPFPVWTTEKAAVTFLGKKYESQNVNGKWLITLDPVEDGGPFTMEIVSNESSVTIKDIYTGDVWMCAGQSNIEMQMSRLCDDFGEEWEIKNYPLIRYFRTPQEWDFSASHDDISGGRWLCASQETLHEFSAVGWFFAKSLYKKYRIPIGLVNASWGGTPVESWMSKDALSSFPDKIAEGEKYSDDVKRTEIANKTQSAIIEWGKNLKSKDIGISEKWNDPQIDISSWDDILLPGDFAGAGIKQFCGVIWLAKDFEVNVDFASQSAKVWLGTIVDADTVFMNGEEIGNTDYRYPPRKYVPKGLLKEGKNRIVIRVTCNNGEGGVTCDKPFRIFTDNESVELSGTWKYKTGATTVVRPEDFFFQRLPMGNYNAMIAPLLKYPFKGVIWYQGESNDSHPYDYAQLFRLMIEDWREKSINKELPFLFVQLPIWKIPSDNDETSSWAIIREAQAETLSLPNTGMAAALEFGEWNDLHPINKKDVGIRLFLAAEKTLNKIKNSSPGPVLQRTEKLGEKLYLYFNNCADGLTTKNNEIPYISVIEGENSIRLPAEIEGKDVISVNLSGIKKLKKILYAWADNPRDRQLFNSEGLPVIPFRKEI